MNKNKLIDQLIIDEGIKLYPYKDSLGIWTIGVGRNLESVGLSKDELIKFNIETDSSTEQIIEILQSRKITKDEAIYLLNNDIDKIWSLLKKAITWIELKPDIAQRVICNMAFNMGVASLLKFSKTLQYIKNDKYDNAATEMLNSKWSQQVGARAYRLANLLRILTD